MAALANRRPATTAFPRFSNLCTALSSAENYSNPIFSISVSGATPITASMPPSGSFYIEPAPISMFQKPIVRALTLTVTLSLTTVAMSAHMTRVWRAAPPTVPPVPGTMSRSVFNPYYDMNKVAPITFGAVSLAPGRRTPRQRAENARTPFWRPDPRNPARQNAPEATIAAVGDLSMGHFRRPRRSCRRAPTRRLRHEVGADRARHRVTAC
jgi:hypothetical protein